MAAARSMRNDRAVLEHKIKPGTFKRMLGFAKPFRGLITGFLLIVILGAFMVAVAPVLLQRIIDDGVVAENRSVVIWLSVAVLAVALVEAGLSILQRWFASSIGEGLISHLRVAVFDHVQKQSLAFFTRSRTGALVSRLNSDVIGAQQAFTTTLQSVVSNVLSVVVVLSVMIAMSWKLTLLALLIVPFLLIPARRVGGRMAALRKESMERNAELSSRMTERFNVAGALLVKLYGTPEDEHAEYAKRAERMREIGVRTAMSSRFFFASLAAMASIATALAYLVGGLMAIDGSLSVGTLVGFAGLLARLYGPLTGLTSVPVDVMTAMVSFERVFTVLDLTPSLTESDDAQELPEGPLSVEVEDVSFAYPDEAGLEELETAAMEDDSDELTEQAGSTPILHELSFSVPAGTMTAVVGPSGAGKTTLTNLIARLYDPTFGQIRMGGVDLREVQMQSLRQRLGMVTQDAHLFHDSLRENLRFAAPGASDETIMAALEAAHVGDLMRRLPEGLDTVVGDRGHRLSGGEKQRVAIARLLLRHPSVVILDEATAHLDSESEVAVQAALDDVMEGRTSIVIAHRLSTVRRADQIVVLAQGRIVQKGTHAELLEAGGLYATLHATQFAQD